MTLKTLIIDDEPIALDKLENYVAKVPYLELVAKCQGTSEALAYLAENQVDVIFTDIDMPDVDGISFVESLTPRPMIVFITAYRDYAVDGFRLSAIDYLVKPYRAQDFQRAANKVLEVYHHREAQKNTGHNPDSLFIKVETRYERISLSKIRYIKGYGEYLQIFIDGLARPLLTISSFAAIKQKLNGAFLQVHRSYIVNMNKVLRIEKSRVVMDADTFIPVTASFREEFMQYVHNNSVPK